MGNPCKSLTKACASNLQSHELQLIHRLLYFSYAVSYVILFPAFSDINKGRILTCI